jgi:hypothetical protein
VVSRCAGASGLNFIAPRHFSDQVTRFFVLSVAHLRDRGQIAQFGVLVLAEGLDGRMHCAVLAHNTLSLDPGSQLLGGLPVFGFAAPRMHYARLLSAVFFFNAGSRFM